MKYLKSNTAHFIKNHLKRICHLLELIYLVTMKICIYI